MKIGKELVCKNCGDGYFYILHNLAIGRIAGKQTHWELLKCMTCGQIQTERFEETI